MQFLRDFLCFGDLGSIHLFLGPILGAQDARTQMHATWDQSRMGSMLPESRHSWIDPTVSGIDPGMSAKS